MARILFTPSDWEEARPGMPHPGTLIAERATLDVDLYLRSAIYDTDANGLPTDTTVREALAKAAMDQAYALALVEASRAKVSDSPLGVPLSSASIGGASWSAGGAALEDGFSLPPRSSQVRLCSYAVAWLATIERWVGIYG